MKKFNHVSNKKARNKAIRDKCELEKNMKDNPDWCFCQELLGLFSDFDSNDPIIGETEPIDGFPYWNSTGFKLNIYRCKRCGKKATLTLVS